MPDKLRAGVALTRRDGPRVDNQIANRRRTRRRDDVTRERRVACRGIGHGKLVDDRPRAGRRGVLRRLAVLGLLGRDQRLNGYGHKSPRWNVTGCSVVINWNPLGWIAGNRRVSPPRRPSSSQNYRSAARYCSSGLP